MGEPVRKASGRTFHPMSTLVSDTCRSSPQVESSHSLKTSNQPPSEALKSGLPMSVFATVKLTFVLRIYNLRVWANVRTSTLFAPPASNTFEHSLTVAPVV